MKIKTIMGIFLLVIVLTGCENGTSGQTEAADAAETITARAESPEETWAASDQNLNAGKICKEVEAACKEMYEYHKGSSELTETEKIARMVKCLGDAGYAAIDQNNQVNMENSVLMEEFCRNAYSGEHGETWLIMVLNNGKLLLLHFSTENGQVDILADTLFWNDGGLEIDPLYADHFQAHSWVYSDEGYLFFEKYYMEGFGGPYDNIAIRIKPIDAACREMNRKYLLPVGYSANNMFLSDWTEKNYGDLNFYDLFERLYEQNSYDISKYVSEATDTGGMIYHIPEEELEGTLKRYFSVSSQILQERLDFIKNDKAYEYRPRGIYDTGTSAEVPYPEVIDFEYTEDGMIRMTVNAVWPEKNTGAAFKHQVTVRPLEDGGFQYVSNHIISSDNLLGAPWYTERLTKEQWKKYYQGTEP